MTEIAAEAKVEERVKGLEAEIQRLQNLRDELQWRVRELTAINTLTQDVIRNLSAPEVIASAYRQIYAAVNPDLMVIYAKQGDQLILQESTNQSPYLSDPQFRSKRVGQCLCGLAAQTGTAIYAYDIHADHCCTLDECKRAGVQSFAALPMLIGNRTTGVLGVAAFQPRDFSKQGTFLSTLAGQVAVALNNARLHDEVKARTADLGQYLARLEQSRDALRRSEYEYRTTLDAMADAMHVVDRDLRLLFFNSKFRRWNESLGLKTDALGQSVFEVFPFLTDQVRKEYERVFQSGQPLLTEEENMLGGQRMITETRKIPIATNGRVERVVTVVRDITVQRQAEERLRQKLKLEKTIAEISSRFVGNSDLDEAICASLTGMGAASGAGRSYLFRFSEDLNAMDNTHEWCAPGVRPEKDNLQHLPTAMFPWWMKQLQTQELIYIPGVSGLPPEAGAEKEILESQGIQSVLVLPVYIGAELAGFVGLDDVADIRNWSHEDIALLRIVSEIIGRALLRQQTEKALVESIERYRALVEDMPAMVCRFKPDGTLTIVNPAYCSFLGRQPQELIGQDFFQFVPQDDQEAFRKHFSDLERSKPTAAYEHCVIGPGGAVVWQEWTGRALFDDRGAVIEYQAAGRDITKRKLAEQHRETLIKELEAKNVELERFTYTVSHDLKSPLVTIKGFLGLLEQDLTGGDINKVRGDIARIGKAADHMRQLLDDLLELSRIGRLVNPFTTVAMDEIVNEALEALSGPIADRQARIEVGTDLPTVTGDRPRLSEAIQNLIENAVVHMGAQPAPRVEIGCRPQGEETVMYVRDNGEGIDPRYRERIFGLFEKLNPAAEGTGVGLAIVKRIVETHGGRIWVESEGVGRGSTFCFTLGTSSIPAGQGVKKP